MSKGPGPPSPRVDAVFRRHLSFPSTVSGVAIERHLHERPSASSVVFNLSLIGAALSSLHWFRLLRRNDDRVSRPRRHATCPRYDENGIIWCNDLRAFPCSLPIPYASASRSRLRLDPRASEEPDRPTPFATIIGPPSDSSQLRSGSRQETPRYPDVRLAGQGMDR